MAPCVTSVSARAPNSRGGRQMPSERAEVFSDPQSQEREVAAPVDGGRSVTPAREDAEGATSSLGGTLIKVLHTRTENRNTVDRVHLIEHPGRRSQPNGPHRSFVAVGAV